MRVGAIDIGTNTVRLLVADVADGAIAVVERRAEVVALGEGVDRWGRLADEAIARTVARLAEYRAITAAHGVERLRVVATSASRDADNSEDFLDQAERVLGVRPEVIGGDEEAALSFRGATSGLPGPGPTLVIDQGGGSTEFVVGDIEPVAFTSVDIGSVRLTERLFPDHPASDEQVAAAAAVVAAMFASVAIPLAPVRAIGVGGTFTSLAAVHLGLTAYDPTLVHGSILTVDDLDELVTTLTRLTVDETQAIPSLEPGRAPVLLGGAVVAREAARRSGLEEIIVSETDLLDGIAMQLGVEG